MNTAVVLPALLLGRAVDQVVALSRGETTPTAVTIAALVFIGGGDRAPMTVTIANLVNSFGSNYEVLTSAAFISMLLPLVVFFSLQRYFVRGILAGSVKG